MTFSKMTFSIMTLSIITLSIMTLSIMTLSIMTLSITTLSIMTFSMVVIKLDTQHNDRALLCCVLYMLTDTYADCHIYAECHYVNVVTLSVVAPFFDMNMVTSDQIPTD
jgi:hypothetical protein